MRLPWASTTKRLHWQPQLAKFGASIAVQSFILIPHSQPQLSALKMKLALLSATQLSFAV
jgi:hypothetical protein